MTKEPEGENEGNNRAESISGTSRFINKEGKEMSFDALTIYENPQWFLDQLQDTYTPFIEAHFNINRETPPDSEVTENVEALREWVRKRDGVYKETTDALGGSAAFFIDVATRIVIEKQGAVEVRASEETQAPKPSGSGGEDWGIYNIPHHYTKEEVPEGITLNPLGEVVVSPPESKRAEGIIDSCGNDLSRLPFMVAYENKPFTDKDKFLASLALRARADMFKRTAFSLWHSQRGDTERMPENYKEQVSYVFGLYQEARDSRVRYGSTIESLAGWRYAIERGILQKIVDGEVSSSVPSSSTWNRYRGWTAEQAKVLLHEIDTLIREDEDKA